MGGFDLKCFDGFNKFEFLETEPNKTQITPTINLTTPGTATFK